MSSEDLRRIVFRNLQCLLVLRRNQRCGGRGTLSSPSTSDLCNHPFEIVICDSYPIDVLIDKLVAELSFRIILSEDFLEG
jgi:spore coat polysaccharide biosynthesis predicted glycosyltransferase SpsG